MSCTCDIPAHGCPQPTNEAPFTVLACSAGSIYSRGGRAEIGGPIAIPENLTLEGAEGVVLRMGADGNAYTLLLYTGRVLQCCSRVFNRRHRLWHMGGDTIAMRMLLCPCCSGDVHRWFMALL